MVEAKSCNLNGLHQQKGFPIWFSAGSWSAWFHWDAAIANALSQILYYKCNCTDWPTPICKHTYSKITHVICATQHAHSIFICRLSHLSNPMVKANVKKKLFTCNLQTHYSFYHSVVCCSVCFACFLCFLNPKLRILAAAAAAVGLLVTRKFHGTNEDKILADWLGGQLHWQWYTSSEW